tara:strand:+ start:2739 stop:3380 length:642 start_codon:yes stop_codon:yes gene_type:complete
VATGFHWTYGVVEQASSAGAGASPLVGMSALNLGSTNPMSGGGGAGSPAITMIPNGAGIFGSEHTVKLSISYSGNGGSIAAVSITPSVSGVVGNPLFSTVSDGVGRAHMDLIAWMDNPDPTTVVGGSGGLDAVFANGNKIIDVVASNAQGGLSTTNEFYIIFQELALQGNAGGTTGGGFDATEFQNGAQVTFTLQATNTNGQTNQTTSTVTMA